MKTKSANKSLAEIDNSNRINDFLKYYKSAAENNVNSEEGRASKNKINDSVDSHDAVKRTPRNKVAKKKIQGKTINIAKIDINGPNLVSVTDKLSPLNDSKVTSTPIMHINRKSSIKPIIKDTSTIENVDVSTVSQKKPKKRNKSVSFMLEDNEEVTIKKTKSDDAVITKHEEEVKNKVKKNKKNQVKIKENKENNEISIAENTDVERNGVSKNKRKHSDKKSRLSKQVTAGLDHEMAGGDAITSNVPTKLKRNQNVTEGINDQGGSYVQRPKKKRVKKPKRHESVEVKPETEQENLSTTAVTAASGARRNKRKHVKKQKSKDSTEHDSSQTQKDLTSDMQPEITDESQRKGKKLKKLNSVPIHNQKISKTPKKTTTKTTDTREKNKKSDALAKEIENLNIGDNAHTLTNLLNGISVDKKNKNKGIGKNIDKSTEDNSNIEESTRKKARKNNNRKKKRNVNAVVLVQNLPFSILLNYKEVLKAHFSKFGNVHSVGVADLKCGKGPPKTIFTTRVFFKTEEAAAAAVTEDRSLFEGNIIRVKTFETQVTRTYKRGEWAKKPLRPHRTQSENKEDNDKEESNEIEQDFCEKFDHDSDDSV